MWPGQTAGPHLIGARFTPHGAHAWIEAAGDVIGQGESDRVWPVRIPAEARMPSRAAATAVRASIIRWASLEARLAASLWSHQAGSSLTPTVRPIPAAVPGGGA
ncbi:hypothetical protein ABT218_31255 [Streptomyces sp. NPDC001455]|uniref:hypothetical protein n=1 Tax=Streptomyces sp. NPDC001455 TaxID=3154518 RepID=UPI003316B479